MYFESQSYDVLPVKSTIDNQEYIVRNLPDKEEASNLLATIRAKMIELVNYLDKIDSKELEIYLRENDSVEDVQKSIKLLKKRFQPDNLSESTPNDKYTSYSVNKGEKLVFCLRARNNNETLVEPNIMIFVALHELSHIMTKSVGHTEEFWNNFRILLRVAIRQKIYHNLDFNNNPQDYCGTKITDTPLSKDDI
jgi:predicted metal-dependent hydrolase